MVTCTTVMHSLVIRLWIGIGLVDICLATGFDDGGRIVGGEPANIIDIPFQLSLRIPSGNSHFCGASIISDKWGVSAAHCFGYSQHLIAVAGASLRSKGGTKHDIVQVFIHPFYDAQRHDNDIAVFKVSNPFPLGSPGVNCINLVSQPPIPGDIAQTSGWGVISEQAEELPDQLQKVLVPIISNRQCSQYYTELDWITEQMICAGYAEGGRDSCRGDSGGPLIVNNKLVGVVSWGLGCAKPRNPGVYARIDKLSSWIKKTTGISNCKTN